jgi:hypothetical protein
VADGAVVDPLDELDAQLARLRGVAESCEAPADGLCWKVTRSS